MDTSRSNKKALLERIRANAPEFARELEALAKLYGPMAAAHGRAGDVEIAIGEKLEKPDLQRL